MADWVGVMQRAERLGRRNGEVAEALKTSSIRAVACLYLQSRCVFGGSVGGLGLVV